MTSIDLSILAAMIDDRWMSADDCAAFFGLFSNGTPNRRAFYERIANMAGFPQPLFIGAERRWRRSEVDLWSRDQRLSRQMKPVQNNQRRASKASGRKKHASIQGGVHSGA